jgi:hypothetical protein
MLVIYLPDGTQVKVKTGMPVYTYTPPVGVTEDEIDVYSIFLGHDQKPAYGCGPVCIKRATKVTVAEAAEEAAAPPIEATEPPATATLTHVEPRAAELHTIAEHGNDQHNAGTTVAAAVAETTVSEPAAAITASATDVPATTTDAPAAAAAATSVAEPAVPAPAVPAPAVPAPAVPATAVPATAVPATAVPVDVKPAKPETPVKHTSNANIGKFETTYDPKHGRKS